MSPYIISLLLLAPYLPAGLKGEYIFVAIATIPLIAVNNFKINKEILYLAAPLILPLFPMLNLNLASEEAGKHASPVIMFLRLVLPGIMLISFSSVLHAGKSSFEKTLSAIAYVAGATSCITIISFFLPGYSSFLAPWVHENEDSVWSQSMSVGRYVGIFNQPLEAGLFYSVALFSVITKLHIEKASISSRLLLLLVIIAGALSLSKVFLVLGLSLALAYATSLKLLSFRFYLLIFLSTPILFILLYFQSTAYFESLLDLYETSGLLFSLTAGRLGDSSTNTDLYTRIFEGLNWVFGFGYGSQLPLDSGYLEYFYQVGVFPLMGYIFFITILLIISYKERISIQGRLIFLLALLIIFASVGGPVTSAGRANIAVMLLLASAVTSKRIKIQSFRKSICKEPS